MYSKKDVIDFLIGFFNSVFSPALAQRISGEAEYLADHSSAALYAQQLSEEVDNTILRLIELKMPEKMSAFANSVDDRVLVFVSARIEHFLNYLKSLNNDTVFDEFHAESFLKEGLIDHFHQSEKLGPYWRNN